MAETKAIMLVGVGGQGTLLASRILGNVLLSAGYDVKVSEVHGMSQRGGSVVTYIKYGDRIFSPVIGSILSTAPERILLPILNSVEHFCGTVVL